MAGRELGVVALALMAGAAGGYLSAYLLPAGMIGNQDKQQQEQAMTEERVRALVKTYVQENPKDIIQSLQNWQVREESTRVRKQQEAVYEMQDYFKEDHHYGTVGPDDASVTLVEFFDYNCPACKMMFESIDSLLQEDDDLRVVFVEFPIFGPVSDKNAQIATAVAQLAPDKYYDFHAALMRQKGKLNTEQLYQIAGNLGIDVEALKAEAESPESEALVREDRELAQKLHIRGTPALLINDRIVNNALSKEDLKNQVEALRRAAKRRQPDNNQQADADE